MSSVDPWLRRRQRLVPLRTSVCANGVLARPGNRWRRRRGKCIFHDATHPWRLRCQLLDTATLCLGQRRRRRGFWRVSLAVPLSKLGLQITLAWLPAQLPGSAFHLQARLCRDFRASRTTHGDTDSFGSFVADTPGHLLLMRKLFVAGHGLACLKSKLLGGAIFGLKQGRMKERDGNFQMGRKHLVLFPAGGRCNWLPYKRTQVCM